MANHIQTKKDIKATKTSQTRLTQCLRWASNLRFGRWGRVKEWSSSHTTLLDFDGGRSLLRDFWRRFHKTCRVIGNSPEWYRYDRTRHGWHVVIYWRNPMSPWMILALQAILGSDWRRESMNFARLSSNRKDRFSMKRWNILYAEKIQ